MTQKVEVNAEDATLEALLQDLNMPDEIIEAKGEAEDLISEVDIEAAAPGALTGVANLITGPTPSAVVPVKKAKVSGKKKKAEPVKSEPAAAGEPEAPKEKKAVARKHYASKVDRISDKLGDKLGDYTLLEFNDAKLKGDDQVAKQQETLEMINKSGIKVQNRITFVLEFISGKTEKLNGVLKTAFELLNKDGKLTVGEKGNLISTLTAEPTNYHPSSAKAMGGNTLLAMKNLKVLIDGEKGELVGNPQSLILIKMNTMLGLKA